MAITLPENQETVSINALPKAQISGATPLQINKDFIGRIENDILGDLKERDAELKKRKQDQIDYQEKLYKNHVTNLTVEAKARVATTKGTTAVEVASTARDDLKKQMDKSLEEIPSELKERFSVINDSAIMDYNSTAIPHEYSEVKKIREQTYAVDTKNSMNKAIGASSSDDAFQLMLADVAKSAREHAVVKYGDLTEDAVKLGNFSVQASVSATVLGAIKQKSQFGDTQGAENTASKFLSLMTPEDKAKAQSFIEKGKEDNRYTDAMLSAETAALYFPGEMDKQVEWLRNNFREDGETFNTAVSMARMNENVQNEAQKKMEREQIKLSFDRVDQEIEALGAVRPGTMNEILRSTPGASKKGVLDYIKSRGNVETDQETFNTLTNMYKNDPDAFIATLPIAKDKLSKTDYSMLQRWAGASINKDKSEQDKVRNMAYNEMKKQIDEIAEIKGIIPEDDPLIMKQLYGKVDADIETMKDVKGITSEEIKKRIVKSLMDAELTIAREGDDVPGTGTSFLGMTFGEDEYEADTLQGIDTIKRDLARPKGSEQGDVHPSVRQWIQRSAFEKYGKFLNEVELRGRIQTYINSGMDPSKAVNMRGTK